MPQISLSHSHIYLPFECDHCVAVRTAKANKTYFVPLPFPVSDTDENVAFPVSKSKSDVSSLTPYQLKKFVSQHESIMNQFSCDENDGISSSVNSKYYTVRNFNTLKPDQQSSFGLMHINIASLNKHFDDLEALLSRLKFNFDVIGISEHKIRRGIPPSTNISLEGYNEFEFEPTDTTHGGSGFYVRQGLDYFVREDLNLNMSLLLLTVY